jgi:ATP/maltotriose-dependent transcriptional regulator MalT
VIGRGLLLEREGVIGAVARLVDGVAEGRAGVLFVVGQAGLGKTSMLDDARGRAADLKVVVGLGRGDAMETSLPFGLLSQLMAAMGGRAVLERTLLRPVIDGDRATQFYQVLRWFEGLAVVPVLVACDDLHWADADSLALIAYLCRRVASLPVAVMATLRPWPSAAHEVALGLVHQRYATVERLRPLSATAAGRLLAERVGRDLPQETVLRSWEISGGNPLLLEQVALAVGRGEDLPPSAELAPRAASEGLLLSRFAGVSEPGMRCAQAASVLGGRFQSAIAAEVGGVGEAEADVAFDALSRSALVRETANQDVEFVHPLFRQALYEDLGGPMRARLHARAFVVLAARGMESEAAEHAIRANLVGDADAIALLERVGRAAGSVGAVATSVTCLQRAVAFAGDRARPDLLVALAEALLARGSPNEAMKTLERLAAEPSLPVYADATSRRLLVRALHLTGAHQDAARRLEGAVAVAQACDQCLAVQVLLESALMTWLTAGPAQALSLAVRARELGRTCDKATQRSAEAVCALYTIHIGDPAGIDLFTSVSRALDRDLSDNLEELARPWGPVANLAMAGAYIERFNEAEGLLARALSAAEQLGVASSLAMLNQVHSYSLIRRGRLTEALERTAVVLGLCEILPIMEAWAAVGHANVLLYMGRLQESEAWYHKGKVIARQRGEWNAMSFLHEVMGHRLLREGRLADACEHYVQLEEIIARTGVGEPCVPAWGRHAVAAYVGAGRLDDASRVIEWLERHAEPLPCRWPRIAAACGRARLAEHHGDHSAAEQHFSCALALHDEVELPVEKVETLLDYGAFLRRSGHPARARSMLHDAVNLGVACSAGWLVELARQELAVAGGRRRRRGDEPDRLTAQERRVARLAAGGATNADIARELHLSVSTIETHMEHIYAKLAIHSRRELMVAAPGLDQDA